MRAPRVQVEPRSLRKVWAALLSGVLHVAVFLAIVLFGDRYDRLDTISSPTIQMVQLAPIDAGRTETAAAERLDPRVEDLDVEPQLSPGALDEPQLATDAAASAESEDVAPPPLSPPAQTEPAAIAQEVAQAPVEPSTVAITDSERLNLTQALTRSAQESGTAAEKVVAWQKDGRQYTATLRREPASDGTALERIIAEVTTNDNGKDLRTRVSMKRLAFSGFTQVVDRWDPFVQLHDDKIAGRFHSNSRFQMTYDSRTAPQFSGKVTTAARSYGSESTGRRRDSDIFQGGIETRADRINLPRDLLPFESARPGERARTHKFDEDTRLTFFPDGSYTWRARGSPETGYVNEPTTDPIYFIAAPAITLYVQGTVAGKVLLYSPERIVIEGHLRYAHDPRVHSDSPDYLGLVCDKFVEVASPGVVGRGDLMIEAAIFAGRRFIVTNIEYTRKATLTIYGSLTAGTISATEPRYATKIDYDPRFERVRPPGFPTTNRFEVDDWDGRWTETEDDPDS